MKREQESLSLKQLKEMAVRIQDRRRQSGNFRHQLVDVLAIVLFAVVCGYSDWDEIALYAKAKEEWLKDLLGLAHGTPSACTIGRVINSIEPNAMESLFREWVTPYVGSLKGEQICVDGKTVRTASQFTDGSLHTVSLWATRKGICLGQMSTLEKSNEITAIPILLDSLSIEGAVVSIDAMGCQTAIAKSIKGNSADYILALKKNQRNFYEAVEGYFPWALSVLCESQRLSFASEKSYDHGRTVRWKVVVTSEVEDFENAKDWAGIRTIILIEKSTVKKDGTVAVERRYYISSLAQNADYFMKRIRSHWGIENSLHWVLDVAFGEDKSRVHCKNAAKNLSLIRKIAMGLMKRVKTQGLSYRKIQVKAALADAFLLNMFS